MKECSVALESVFQFQDISYLFAMDDRIMLQRRNKHFYNFTCVWLRLLQEFGAKEYGAKEREGQH